ncbi:hypothetical protein B0H12DRAFT_849263 [Mycena haematopus]|nr:hypothetical protein B0H12DRAFT_849263 [Mycena haematopus]
MSTKELQLQLEVQARIDKLVADIDLQKTVLKQLEWSKSAAQRELNAICDPMERLPLEISTTIFLQCLPRSHRHWPPEPRTAPILLLSVCSAWTNIALSTPALWASIHLEVPRVEVLQTWLERTHNHPLSISLRSCLDSRILTVLQQYAKQLQHLEIYDDELDDLDSLTGRVSFPSLETLTVGALGKNHEEDPNILSLNRVLALLSLAPNLVECTFHDIYVDISEDDDSEVLVLPKLRCLKFGTTTDIGDLDGEDQILQYLSLPAASTLVLPLMGISSTDFLLFFKRSSPPLQKLVLGPGCSGLGFHGLAECLRMVPSLLHLELDLRHHGLIEELFAALADPSHFLPRLGTLKVLASFSPSCAFYEKVLRALSTRSTQLVCVELIRPFGILSKIDADIRDGFRSLAAEGIKIYIGTHGDNFI